MISTKYKYIIKNIDPDVNIDDVRLFIQLHLLVQFVDIFGRVQCFNEFVTSDC